MTLEKNELVFEAFIACDPKGKARPRLGRGGRVYTPRNTKDLETLISTIVKSRRPILQTGPQKLVLEFLFHKPKTSKNREPIVKPDVDNCVKLVCDSLNNILYDDDSRIVELVAKKRYTDKITGIHITQYI